MPLYEHSRYINPYTDFGFKLLFGTEVNKDLLIAFLNELLQLDSAIEDLTYQKNDKLGDTEEDRRAVFDVYCTNERGEHFIVEMQRAIQSHFIERSIYYSTFPIREQAQKGKNWDFDFKAVYTVGILDFCFDDIDPEYYHHEVKLVDVNTHKPLTDKLNFIYLEMPKFNKEIEECDTLLEKFMFVLKNLTRFMDRPVELQERVFMRLFEVAEIAKFTREERFAYEESLKIYRDYKNTLDTAQAIGVQEGFKIGHKQGLKLGLEQGRAQGLEQGRAQGLEQGRAQGIITTAKNLKSMGLSVEQIVKATGLSSEEIIML